MEKLVNELLINVKKRRKQETGKKKPGRIGAVAADTSRDIHNSAPRIAELPNLSLK